MPTFLQVVKNVVSVEKLVEILVLPTRGQKHRLSRKLVEILFLHNYVTFENWSKTSSQQENWRVGKNLVSAVKLVEILFLPTWGSPSSFTRYLLPTPGQKIPVAVI